METNNLENEVLDILQKAKEVILEYDRQSNDLINKARSKVNVLQNELQQYSISELQDLAKSSPKVKTLLEEFDTLMNDL